MNYENETRGNLIAMLESRDRLISQLLRNNMHIAELHDKRCEENDELNSINLELKRDIVILKHKLIYFKYPNQSGRKYVENLAKEGF